MPNYLAVVTARLLGTVTTVLLKLEPRFLLGGGTTLFFGSSITYCSSRLGGVLEWMKGLAEFSCCI